MDLPLEEFILIPGLIILEGKCLQLCLRLPIQALILLPGIALLFESLY